jgi:hypothetical protein
MAPKDWAITQSTTNLGESQHYWTNQHTGIKHSLVEAIVMLVHLFYSSVILSSTDICLPSAQKLDDQTAAEIQASCKTGVLTNNHNNTYNHMS